MAQRTPGMQAKAMCIDTVFLFSCGCVFVWKWFLTSALCLPGDRVLSGSAGRRLQWDPAPRPFPFQQVAHPLPQPWAALLRVNASWCAGWSGWPGPCNCSVVVVTVPGIPPHHLDAVNAVKHQATQTLKPPNRNVNAVINRSVLLDVSIRPVWSEKQRWHGESQYRCD